MPGTGNLIEQHRASQPPRSARHSMVDPHEGNINERIVAINVQQSAIYVADDSARRRHWAKHRTYLACLKCMDGRVHLPQATGTPMGLVKPFRGIGGRFEVFWPSFIDRIETWSNEAMGNGTRCVVFASYHYSDSNPKLACAGWDYDTSSARGHAQKLTGKLSQVFGDQMIVIPMGVETDRDMLTLHGSHGDIAGDRLIGLDEGEIRQVFSRCMPKLDGQIVHDLMPFLMGNAQRVDELTKNPRDVSHLGHQERVLALGECFDWLARQNFALINNDSDPNLDEAIIKAANILAENLDMAGPGEEATIFTNAPYAKAGQSERKAIGRAEGLQEFAQFHIKRHVPKLWNSGRLRFLIGITFEPSKALSVLAEGVCR